MSNWVNTPALIYYYFGNPDVTTTVSKHLGVPIILGIATARKFHPAVPIYVIDASEVEMDWEDYPEFLSFKVMRRRSPVCEIMKKAPVTQGVKTIVKLLAKPIAVKELLPEINQTIPIVLDSDLFWVHGIFRYKILLWRQHRVLVLSSPCEELDESGALCVPMPLWMNSFVCGLRSQ